MLSVCRRYGRRFDSVNWRLTLDHHDACYKVVRVALWRSTVYVSVALEKSMLGSV
jgi:hypothetical protein